MAESNFIYYRGFPMVRSGNEIYYGSMGDRFVTKLTIRESEKYKDADGSDDPHVSYPGGSCKDQKGRDEQPLRSA